MQTLTANLLVINSTRFEKNFMIFGADYATTFFSYFLSSILKIAYSKPLNHKYQIVSFDRALQALQPGILFPFLIIDQKKFILTHCLK